MSDIIAERNTWRYYEGLTSSKTFLKDLSRVLSTGVKTNKTLNPDGTVLLDREVIKDSNWDIVYPVIKREELISIRDWNNLSPEEYMLKINRQLSKIKDTVILKMTTDTNNFTRTIQDDDLSTEDDLIATQGHIYVELYKPLYLADNEKYSVDCERYGVQPYNATQEIYRNALSNKAFIEVNLLDSLIPTEVKDIITNKTIVLSDVQENAMPDDLETLIARQIVLEINNIMSFSLEFPESGADPIKITLDNKDLLKIRGTSLEPILVKKFNLSIENIEVFKTLNLTFSYKEDHSQGSRKIIDQEYKPVGWMGVGGQPEISHIYSWNTYTKISSFTFEFHDIYSVYSVPAGFTYTFKEKDNLFKESISLKVGNSAPRKLDKDFTYDESTYSIKLITPIQGEIRIIGEPILSYKFKKTNNDVVASETINNDYYALIRLFDNIKEDMSGPLENAENTQFNSHISEWSKLSWYQDFEEVLAASLNGNLNVNDITDGTINVPVEIKALTSETKFTYRVNTNKNRAIISVTGNDAIDFRKNRYLTGIAYIGQIESFENSINDTIGNFALFASSSSIPCYTKTSFSLSPATLTESQIIGMGPGDTFTCTLKSDKVFDFNGEYSITVVNEDTSENVFSETDLKVTATSNDNFCVNIKLAYPAEENAIVKFNYSYKTRKVTTVNGVTRDGYGNVIDITYPNNFGIYSANGITDISMYTSKTKLYYQKHYMMFATTEEFMSKSMYGKSAYTDEYYADRIKIIHPVDGPRGMLFDCLAIDSHSLLPFDDLVVNKNFNKDRTKPEETYIYIPVTTAYSPFCSSPNGTFGFAIKKFERYSRPETDDEKVDSAIRELGFSMRSLLGLTADIALPSIEGDVTITWESSDNTLIEISEVP